MRAAIALAAGAVVTLAAALWWRKNPSACPYGQRFWVKAPRPLITRERLRAVLRPKPGERVLEIGPGVGYYTLAIAAWVGVCGRVEIFDIQPQFLDHTLRRAADRGLHNVLARQGNAAALPYEDASVDAVVLTAVLGEVRQRAAALGEIRRVLRPSGRLVVGELFGDPHFTSLASLKRQSGAAGLTLNEHSGNWFGYFARLGYTKGQMGPPGRA